MRNEEDTYRKGILDTLVRIEAQTTKTNGRVTRLERTSIIIVTGALILIAIYAPELAKTLTHLVV